MSNAARQSEIESKIIYSIFQKRPKRADILLVCPRGHDG
jgi:KUP system potassium uptake protein